MINITNDNVVTDLNAIIGTDSNTIINEYLDYLFTVRGYSNNTLTSYRHDLVWLLRYLKLRDNRVDLAEIKAVKKNGEKYLDYTAIDVSDININDIKNITTSDLTSFLAFTAKTLGNSANSRKRKVASLKGFFRYLTIDRHLLDKDPSAELRTPKIQKSLPSYLSLEKAQELMNAPLVTNDPHKIRDRAILTVFLNTGLRVSELTNLKLSDIQFDTIHITGKGKKDRLLYLNEVTMQALSDYLSIRDSANQLESAANQLESTANQLESTVNQLESKKNRLESAANQLESANHIKDWVFLSQRGAKFSTRGIEHLIEKYIKIIGLDPHKYTVHSLRHTAATLMHRYGHVDIRVLQEVLGHESTATTEIYTHLENQEVRYAMNSLCNCLR